MVQFLAVLITAMLGKVSVTTGRLAWAWQMLRPGGFSVRLGWSAEWSNWLNKRDIVMAASAEKFVGIQISPVSFIYQVLCNRFVFGIVVNASSCAS